MALKEKQVFGRGSYARSSSKTTQCFSCQGQSYSDCLSAGQTEQCMSDETSCFVREYTQEGGIVGVYMGCLNTATILSQFCELYRLVASNQVLTVADSDREYRL